jgi:hypothetical protein
MPSRDPGRAAQDDADARWQGSGGAVLVEFKKTHSMRDVRHALLTLAYLIRREPPSTTAVCVLVGSRLSDNRLREELQQLRQVIHPEIASRVHYLVGKGPSAKDSSRNIVAFSGSLTDAPADFYPWLEARVAAGRVRGHGPQLPPRQGVIAALAQLRLRNHAPVTVKHLQEVCDVSYPTAAAVLKELTHKGWLEDKGERGVRLRPLTVGEWMELARDHARLRKAQLFTDPTGQSTPERMARRLARLQASKKLPRSVRVGGVLGAAGHFPALDITDAPRLDISVDAEPARVAALLDAGLQPKTRPEQRVALAVHGTREPLGDEQGPGSEPRLASELECLADLIEMGYAREASEMARHMESISKAWRPAS